MGLIADMKPRAYAAAALVEAPWREPVDVVARLPDEPHTLALLSDGSARARWSYFLRAPAVVLSLGAADPGDAFVAAARLLGQGGASLPDAPPFQGGVAGIAAYEAGLRREPSVAAARAADWPDLEAGLYPALLAFDHQARRLLAVGRGASDGQAAARARAALAWLEGPARPPAAKPLAASFGALGDGAAYRAAVAEVVARIGAGEIFQANIARTWAGRLAPQAQPLDLFMALAGASPAPMAAYLRLPGRAVVSNSPERFIAVDAAGAVETRPIKGTRPRGSTPTEDARLASELAASPKDRAENLMIVDLMRNDLARACAHGTVEVPERFVLESFANVHHLVSTVRGRLAPGSSALDLMGAAFPPGSVTGAPKVQAMRVIAGLEPPRGPYCGSIFWAGFDGAFDSSVLIRTAALLHDAEGWRFEARAGAGIVADSDPAAEDAEAEAKIAALAHALGGRP